MTPRESYRDFARRPTLQLMATMACNLRCSYCPVEKWLLDKPTDGFLRNPQLIALVEEAPEPLSFIFGGGEPLMSPDLVEFVARYGAQGHRFGFDTNGTINRRQLARILDRWDPSWIAYFDISHHLDQRVPLKTIAGFSEELRSRGYSHYVKYIGRPCDRVQIDACVADLEARGVAAIVALYMGEHADVLDGETRTRVLPGAYTDDELDWLLGHVRVLANVTSIAGGLHAKGAPCRAGNDFLLFGDFSGETRRAWPCCHGQHQQVDPSSTYIGGGAPRGLLPCTVDGACFIHHMLHPDGYYPQHDDDYSVLFEGPARPLEPHIVADYLRHLRANVAPPFDPVLYQRVIDRLDSLDRTARGRRQSA